ncbi:oxygen-independent coproporphyrinogen III oxidase [Cerasicoccus arenae]|uniref:Coproporphyrinogen-III oxidase n=1 Tax=Cerasicoccus arenae TaxID=424488 RepID=A0A8J3DFZ2_9BACT|nr:oxygen-independent coproporphyrinogen III oxidase [Cerasicoccus arenae]MBK1858412.1 oxygen-independent coproporphyrinogen III oxidase [Cerasicoccus arenae]GHC02382.1 oxygen-independent coproporphyrinogen III oxidase [Cerasicoccus arenae]
MELSDNDIALIEKYQRPGPRYTSYPPANHFQEIDDPTDLLAATKTSKAPLSLYFHLPFCETLCWFCGCHTITTIKRDRADDYLNLLEKEVELFSQILLPGRSVVQMHFGGGTPNFLTGEQINRLGSIIKKRFQFSDDAEISVELDPRRLNEEHVAAFARMGATRASFGVQDCDPEVQQAIHRVQPQEQNFAAMDLLRAHGFTSINIDLIYGLPRQSISSFERTLQAVLELSPERFAIFNYAHIPWVKPAQKNLERHGLPSAAEKLGLLKLCIETLTTAGYEYIGLDHFALPSDELVVAQKNKSLQRNFQGYSTRARVEICGFGVSSISQSAGAFRQNEKELDAYRAALENGCLPITRGYCLTQEDRLRGAVIMKLMCDLSLDFDDIGAKWGINFQEHFADAISQLDELAADGLISLTSQGLKVTSLGRLFIRNLAMLFDAYLTQKQGRYSSTV